MYKKWPDESQNFYRITSAYVIVFLMIIASIIGIFTVTMAVTDYSESATTGTKGTGPIAHIEALKLAAQNDASWNDAKTTALSAIALLSAAEDMSGSWQNSNEVEVSLANSEYPNTLDVMKTYIVKPDMYGGDAVVAVEDMALNLLAIHAFDSDYDESDALEVLKGTQDSKTGSWNNDVYQTALASYTISIVSSPKDISVTNAVNYLKNEEVESSWGAVLESSLAILALQAADVVISNEVTELSTNIDRDGSFGNVESTAWAIVAISVDPTGGSIEIGMDAQKWLAAGDTATLSTTEVALSVLGESIDLTSEETFDPSDNKTDDGSRPPEENGTEDANNPLGAGYNGDGEAQPFWDPAPEDEKRFEETDAPDEPFGDNPIDDTTDFFSSDNLLWVIVAIASILIIVSFATYGLIARIEEGKALNGVRRDIMEYIKHNPGEHFAGIMHEFDMSPSSTTYHLKVLEDTDQVVAHKDNKYKRFYAAGNTIPSQAQTKDYKELMSVLKNATSRKIVWYLLANQGASQKTVAEALEIHPSTVNWHANRLKEIGILEKLKSGKEVAYTIIMEDSVRSVMAIIEEGT
jgi:predicted transcriptional regulator